MESTNQTPSPRLQFRSSKLSDTGFSHQHNEDFAGMIEPANPALLDQSGCLYVIADGVGVTRQGEHTSQYVVERVLSEYYQMPQIPPGQRLDMIIQQVGNEIEVMTSENSASHPVDRPASTVLAAVIHQDRLTVAVVGDSRAYLIHDGNAQQIARDHYLLSELARIGGVSVEEAETSAAQSELPQSLGSHQSIKVEIFEDIPLYPGDIVLLCTDGLTRYVSDEQLSLLVDPGTPDEICRRLVDYSNDAGGEDNVTVLVVGVDEGVLDDQSIGPLSTLPGEQKIGEGDIEAASNVDSSTTTNGETRSHSNQRGKSGRALFLLAAAVGLMVIICLGLAVVLLIQQAGGLTNIPIAPASTQQISSSATETPMQIVLKAEHTVTSTVTSSSTPAIVVPTNTIEIATATQVFQPIETSIAVTTTPGLAEINACVRQVNQGEGLFSIIRQFELTYNQDAVYEYFSECSVETNTCTGQKEILENHQNIFPGWYIVIPEVDETKCEQGSGLWIQWEESVSN